MAALLQYEVSLVYARAHHISCHVKQGVAVDAGIDGKDHGIAREAV